MHGANVRDPVKGYGHQDLHVDVPKRFEDDWWVVNSMVMFDDMTLDNGPTRIVRAHTTGRPSTSHMSTSVTGNRSPCRKRIRRAYPRTSRPPIRGRCSSKPRRLGHYLQLLDVARGTLKKTDAPRRMLHLSYTRRDLPQQLVQLDYLTQDSTNE